MTIRVLLAEDHHLVRSGIRALLESAPEVEVVGEAGDGRTAVQLSQELRPDVVLMDVAMPQLNGIEATRQIRALEPGIEVLMLSMHDDRQYVFESIKAGASGFVLKEAVFAELLTALRAVATEKRYFSPAVADAVMDDYMRRAKGQVGASDLDKISAREREVLQLIAEGKSSAQLAEILHISVRTADSHRHNIMQKLEIHSIAGLTKFAIRHGLSPLR